MGKASDIRELALQALYQLDVCQAKFEDTDPEVENISQTIMSAPYSDDEHGSLSIAAYELQVHEKERAFTIAKQAWRVHKQADKIMTELAPDWPTYRQPLMDRNILRLAFYEMAFARVPFAIVISEAVELAKAYGADNSRKFINGVLDQVKLKLVTKEIEADKSLLEQAPADDWLTDALADVPPELKDQA